MTEEIPTGRPRTFAEKLAERPRARLFTIFTILGFGVTPAAIVILFTRPADTTTSAGGSGVRIEWIVAVLLIATHFLCAFLAWRNWKHEVPRPMSEPPRDESSANPWDS